MESGGIFGPLDTQSQPLVAAAPAESNRTHRYKTHALEARYQLTKALPMGIAGVFRSWTSILELRALGHIGSKQLAGRSLALLLVNLTGYLLMYGLGGALESLCSQAFTAAHGRKKVGVYVQHSLWLFLAANVPVILLWLNPDTVFRMLSKTDEEVLHYARVYLQFECLYFPCIVVQTCLKRFLLAQGLMKPTLLFELAGLVAMYVGLQLFVWNPNTSLGFVGVPLASTIAYFAILVANILYIVLSPCRSEWGPFTMAGFRRNARLIRVGVPCAISGIASYGFADLATIAVTALGTESLAIQAVLNSSKSALTRTGSYLGMVISNRVGNLLGAREPEKAFLSAKVCILMTFVFTSLVAVAMLIFRRSVASFVTDDEALISDLLPVIPLLVAVVVFDMVSNVLTGVLRGQGRQGIAATIRVLSLYGLAVPLAYALCFPLGLGLYGLWTGLCAGFIAISLAEGWLVFTSDWPGEVTRCMERINGPKQPQPIDSPLQESSSLVQPGRGQH
ncbi:MATE efflux family protein [Martensiomyces pterosporus]|nr:MATE efflux family protein [Martensiomyces pterosporus]